MAIWKKKAKQFDEPYKVSKAITKGNAATKLSMIIMGFGNIAHKQVIKGLLFLALEATYLVHGDKRYHKSGTLHYTGRKCTGRGVE